MRVMLARHLYGRGGGGVLSCRGIENIDINRYTHDLLLLGKFNFCEGIVRVGIFKSIISQTSCALGQFLCLGDFWLCFELTLPAPLTQCGSDDIWLHICICTQCACIFCLLFFIVFIRQQSIAWANVDQDLCRHMALLDPNKYQAIEIDVVYFANIFTKSFESEVSNLLVQSNTI